MSCWEQFGGLLAWEAEDPALAAEHFLTVATYNLQHPAQFTDEALDQLRAALTDYLDQRTSVAEILRRFGRRFAGPRRVVRPEAERRRVRRDWPLTIADVYQTERPDGAAYRVRAWAEVVRAEWTRRGKGGVT